MTWLGRLQGRLSLLRDRLRYRQEVRQRSQRRQRRQKELRRHLRPYWFARLLRRSQWRYRSRFWRDQPKVLLPKAYPSNHPRPIPENSMRLRYQRRQKIRERQLLRRPRPKLRKLRLGQRRLSILARSSLTLTF